MDIEDIKSKIEFYVESKRPKDAEMRKKIDIGYTFQDNELEIFEASPRWDNPVMIQRRGVAKAKYIKSRNLWKIYWLRASLKWNAYEPCPQVETLPEFFKILDEDKYHCFWG